MVTIYALIDPATQQCRYVGKSKNLRARYYDHLYNPQGTRKSRWIGRLLKQGLKPEVVVLEEVAASEWPEHEQFWIAYMKALGANLTNTTVGGEGGVFTSEIRLKLSLKAKEQWANPGKRPSRGAHTPERCAQQSETLRQYLANPIALEKRIAQFALAAGSPKRLENLRAAAQTPESRDRQGRQLRAWSDAHPAFVKANAQQLQQHEIKARCDEAKRSPGVRARMSESAKKRWARDRDLIVAAQNEGKRNKKK